MKFGGRIKAEREARKWSQKQLALKAGLPPDSGQQTVAILEERDSSRSTYAPALARALGLTLEYALTGQGVKYVESADKVIKDNVTAGPKIYGSVPLISWVQAGSWQDAADPYSVGDAEDWLPCIRSHGPRTYCLRVRGQSMYNPGGQHSYSEGDIIFVDPDRIPEHGDRVIVRLEDKSETTFKQYIEEDGERFLKALNPNWPEPIIKVNSEATFCGVIISTSRIEK